MQDTNASRPSQHAMHNTTSAAMVLSITPPEHGPNYVDQLAITMLICPVMIFLTNSCQGCVHGRNLEDAKKLD